MNRHRHFRISGAKIGLIHVAKNQLGMDDDTYRSVLERVAGVRSAKELDEGNFAAVMQEFERYGFTRQDIPVKHAAHTEGRPTEAQWRSMETLARKVGYDGLLDPRFVKWMQARGKVSHPQFLDGAGAQSIIAALTSWSRRLPRRAVRRG